MLVHRYLARPLSFVCSHSGWGPPACLALLYTDRRFGLFSHEELTVLSSSQATPVCTCPARSLRWCPPVCHNTIRTHAFQRIKTVGFPRHHNRLSMLSLWTTTIQFSEICHAAYALITPGFTHHFAAMRTGSLQAGWLLLPGGTCSLSLTHPLGNNN